MTDDERQELATLRAGLTEAEALLRRLGERLRALEGKAGAAATGTEAAPDPPPVAPHVVVVEPPSRRAPRSPRLPDALARPLRAFFTEGNPLDKLGALSLIVGAAIVFKYAVDNDWIGPAGRVALGLATGAALLTVGELYARRGWRAFASGLVAAGDGVLFVAIWFGQQQYGVIPAALAFGLYVVVTAAVVAQSLRYDALALAVWGLLGGYLAPALASTGSGNYPFLATYLLVLDGGVLAIAYRRDWRPLKWMAFLLTLGYTGAWVYDFSAHPGDTRWLALPWLLPYLAAFFVTFAAIPTWRSLRLREPIDGFGQTLTVVNGAAHFVFAAVALHDYQRAWLGLLAVAVALLYAVVSSRVARQPALDAPALRVFTGTAAAFLVLATPYLASGPAITLVWCGETALLAWGCTRPRFAFLRLHVLVMLAIIGLRLVAYDGLLASRWMAESPRYIPFAQLSSWSAFAAAATFIAVARLLPRIPDARAPASWVLGAGLLVLVAAVDGEAQRTARQLLAPLASGEIQLLIRAGLLATVICALWFGGAARLALPWTGGALVAAALVYGTSAALVGPGGYAGLLRSLGDGFGLGWLHGAVLLLAPLVVLLGWLAREAPSRAFGLPRERLQQILGCVALGIALLLLRREAFALTHAPPLADLFPDAARRASYRTVLSLSFALLAFGIYVSAIRTRVRERLLAAYALYILTAFKVYVFDLESQNQLFRAFSLVVFAAILFVSSYFANREQRSLRA